MRRAVLVSVALLCLTALAYVHAHRDIVTAVIVGFQDEEFDAPQRITDYLTVQTRDGSLHVLVLYPVTCCIVHPYDGDIQKGQTCTFAVDLWAIVRDATCE